MQRLSIWREHTRNEIEKRKTVHTIQLQRCRRRTRISSPILKFHTKWNMTWSTVSSRWPITFMCIRYVLIKEGKSVDVIGQHLSSVSCVLCDSWNAWIMSKTKSFHCSMQRMSLAIHVMENGFENNKITESFRMLSQLALTQKFEGSDSACINRYFHASFAWLRSFRSCIEIRN